MPAARHCNGIKRTSLVVTAQVKPPDASCDGSADAPVRVSRKPPLRTGASALLSPLARLSLIFVTLAACVGLFYYNAFPMQTSGYLAASETPSFAYFTNYAALGAVDYPGVFVDEGTKGASVQHRFYTIFPGHGGASP